MNPDAGGRRSLAPEDWPGGIPPCLIHVDKEGRMWHEGAPMVHEGINQLLMAHVELDAEGRYLIHFRGQRCFVEVEDTFFVVVRLEAETDGDGPAFFIVLNDGSREELDPGSLVQNDDNVLYARVKEGRFPARFLRPSYYQFAEHVTERDGRFVVVHRGREFPIG